MNNKFLSVDGILVSREIIDTKFACNLSECKGACCTLESEFGAPLNIEEIAFITDALPSVLDYLPEKHKNEIIEHGFYEVINEEILTRSIDNRACVFVYYENDIAFCGLEKAYFDKKTFFRKPISCHLFPIRIRRFGGDILQYERFSECKAALIKGEEIGCSIADFCKDSVQRKYGENWYNKFKEEAGV